MALKDTYTDVWENTHAEAIIKIDESVEDWKSLQLTAKYFVYKNADHAKTDKPPIYQGEVRVNKLNATPAEKQAAKAWRDALTLMVKSRIFETGTVVADEDPSDEPQE